MLYEKCKNDVKHHLIVIRYRYRCYNRRIHCTNKLTEVCTSERLYRTTRERNRKLYHRGRRHSQAGGKEIWNF